MKKKTSWYINLLKHYYGDDELDEDRIQELNRIGSNAFFMLFIYFLVMMLFLTPSVLALMDFHSKIAVLILGIIIGVNFLVFFVICAYISAAAADLHLDDVKFDSESAYLKKVHRYKKMSIRGGILAFIVFRLSDIFTSGVNGESMLSSLISPFENILNAVMAILLTVFFYFASKSMVQKK